MVVKASVQNVAEAVVGILVWCIDFQSMEMGFLHDVIMVLYLGQLG